eukprot:15433729-Alexandrium_andersonii.AAC.1
MGREHKYRNAIPPLGCPSAIGPVRTGGNKSSPGEYVSMHQQGLSVHHVPPSDCCCLNPCWQPLDCCLV